MTDSFKREFEWLQALNSAFLDFRGELAGECEHTPREPDFQPLFNIIRRELPEKAAERLVGLLTGTDQNYAYRVRLVKNKRNMQKLNTTMGHTYLVLAVQELVDAGLSVSAAVGEISLREGLDVRTIWTTWSDAKSV